MGQAPGTVVACSIGLLCDNAIRYRKLVDACQNMFNSISFNIPEYNKTGQRSQF